MGLEHYWTIHRIRSEVIKTMDGVGGFEFSLGLKPMAPWSWGFNGNGQLGLGDNILRRHRKKSELIKIGNLLKPAHHLLLY